MNEYEQIYENEGDEEPDYVIKNLNTLAFPKSSHPKCELTGLPATCELICKHLTLYYSSQEYAEMAWIGIISKIAPLLGPLRAPAPIVGSKEDRVKREYTLEMSKRAIIDLCLQEASKFLVAEQYSYAIPAAVQALNFCRDIFGEGSIELVPPYLVLAEANLGLRRLQPAEEFLSLANWSVLKNPDCSNTIRSKLHRNFGKLYSAQGRFDDALNELGKDVYCCSLEGGPECIDACGGYFQMGLLFHSQEQSEQAFAFYDKIVDIWYKCLSAIRNDENEKEGFSESQITEGLDMLNRILSTRLSRLGEEHIATGEAKYTLGLLLLFVGNIEQSRDLIRSASEIYNIHLGEEHPLTSDLLMVLQQLEMNS